ncbi:hypothetical protein KA531_00450 [Candidatus Saccharibacteria bacterium]|nr:hypothetical protein [Candidatus Saccharibacteria bacterium]
MEDDEKKINAERRGRLIEPEDEEIGKSTYYQIVGWDFDIYRIASG